MRGGATGTASPVSGSSTTINLASVLDYDATGDGVTDDSAAILNAVADLGDGDALFFPPGNYRFAQTSPTNGAAIFLDGLDRVTIWFAPGAELQMDNLNDSGEGTSHGVAIVGASDSVTLFNVTVRWPTAPSSRSTGDGFHILGYPNDTVPGDWTGSTGAVTALRMISCRTFGAPQTGAILMGCSDATVENFYAESTFADGLHFNCCRRLRVNGVSVRDNGDDGLALVSYHDTSDQPTSDIYGTQVGPFSQNTRTEWCDSGAVNGVTVDNSSANGVRLAGAVSTSLSGIKVSNCSVAGIDTDSGIKGTGHDWTYLASLGVSVTGAEIEVCDVGILASTYNITDSSDASYWTGDVSFADVVIRDCTSRSLRVEGGSGAATDAIAGMSFHNIKCYGADGSVSFSALRDASISGIYTDGADIEVIGSGAAQSAMSDLADNDLQIDDLHAKGGSVAFQDLRRCQIGRVRSSNASGTGVSFTRVLECDVGDVQIVLPNRGNTGTVRGLLIAAGQYLTIGSVRLLHDDNTTTTWHSLEIGGGSATDISKSIEIVRFVYTNTIDTTDSGVTVQSGTYAPVDFIYRMRHFNGGETSPIWRTEHWGKTTWVDHFVDAGTPESAITAPIGSTYQRTDGSTTTTLYIKESGTSSTGWVAK